MIPLPNFTLLSAINALFDCLFVHKKIYELSSAELFATANTSESASELPTADKTISDAPETNSTNTSATTAETSICR